MEEAGTDKLTDEDIEIIAYIAAKVNSQLQKIRKKYVRPKDYGKRLVELGNHKDNMIACTILFEVKNLDPDKFYKPEEFREIVIKKMQTDAVNYSTDIVAALKSHDQDVSIDYKDMNRAIEELHREVGLINITGKQNIKKVSNTQKIKFTGSPSVYKLPSDVSVLRKAMSKPKVIELIIKSLKRMDLLDNLVFFVEGIFHAIRYSLKEEAATHRLINLFIRSADASGFELDMSSWESYSTMLLFMDEIQLKMLANKIGEGLIEQPELYHNILLTAMSKP